MTYRKEDNFSQCTEWGRKQWWTLQKGRAIATRSRQKTKRSEGQHSRGRTAKTAS